MGALSGRIRRNVSSYVSLWFGISGFLLALGFPPYYQVYCVLLSFIGLGGCLETAEGWDRIRGCALFGTVFYLTHAYWFASFHPLALPMVLLLTAVYFGAWGYLVDRAGSNPWLVAGSWMILQWLIGSGFLAFPWSRIATAFAVNPWLAQPVHFAGELVFGGFVVLLGVSLSGPLTGTRTYYSIAVSITVLLILWTLGYRRLRHTDLESTGRLVSLVQPSVESTFNPSNQPLNQRAVLERLTRSRVGDGRLVVWPETALDNFPLEINPFGRDLRHRNPRQQRRLRMLLPDDSTLLTGLRLFDPVENRLNLMNGAVLLDNQANPADFYTKRIMVPFGEYVPGMGRWKWVEEMGRAVGTLGYRAGRFGGLIVLSGSSGSERAAVQICYEDVFPKYVYRQVNQGAEVLVNISNDSWSRSRAAHWQHFYRARLRAIETGRTMLRNGNTGVSAIIDPYGRIREVLAPYRRGVVSGEIYKPLRKSFIVKEGELVTVSVILILVVFGLTFKSVQYTEVM